MEAICKAILGIHIFTGFSSLILFWLPILVKKGGKAHRIIGKIYVFLMWIVTITSFILSIENYYDQFYGPAAFLGFLGLITANPLWYGIAILKQKKELSPSYRNIHMLFNAIIVLAGFGLLSYGIILQGQGFGLVMIIFGIVGIFTAQDILKMYKNPSTLSNRMVEHIKGMLITGIAAHTAFAVFGGGNFLRGIFTGFWMVIPWFLPTVIGLTIIKVYTKKYKPTNKQVKTL